MIYNCIQQQDFEMQVSKEASKNEDLLRLIDAQWELVIRGKQAYKLVQLMQSYQMDIRTAPINTNQGLIEKYALSLLFNGQYLQLSFLLQRHQSVQNKQELASIAGAGVNQQLQNLGSAVTHYLSLIPDLQLKERLKSATLHAILKILSKYFISFPLQKLKSIFESSQGEVEQLGYSVQGGFVQLKEEMVETDCLLTKLKQLASVANKMSKFE